MKTDKDNKVRHRVKMCFFCDKFCLVVPNEYETEKRHRKRFFKEFGYLKQFAGQVGNKSVCEDCLSSLTVIMEHNHPEYEEG